MIFRISLLVLLLAGSTSMADVPARLEAAFKDWVQEAGAGQAVMTVYRKGQPVRDVALGWQADAPLEMASLSKAVTAACVAHLIKDGTWQATTTSRAVLGAGMEGVTVDQLLTHTSGLGPDQTQASMQRWLDKTGRRAQKAALRALGRSSQTGTPGRYQYNNENYAVLGAMITAETGKPYGEFCADTVLAPAGVTTATPSERAQRFLPWGGWAMSVRDYAAFHWHTFGPDGIIGRDPTAFPGADLRGGVQYGMGMFQRPMRGTHNYWHFGALCFPGRLNIGSYAVLWLEDYSVVAAYDVCTSFEMMGALDAALVRAVFQ